MTNPNPLAGIVKPLEWEQLSSRHWRAPSPLFGNFRVEQYGVKGAWHALWSVPGICDTFAPGDFATAEDAMAAVDARILAAIDTDRIAALEADNARLRAQVADLQRSRDRYRAEWEQARAREGALSLACPEEHRAVLTKGPDHD